MKKIISILIVLLLIFSLAGCSEENSVEGNKIESSGKADSYPGGKPIDIIVGYSAGGSSDLGVRMLVPYLEEELGTTINVINKTGANGWVAWTELSKSKPDGYTIGLVNIPGFYSGYLDKHQKRSENLESFKFIANQVSDWGVLVAKKGQFKDFTAFMEYAKSNEVTVGDVGIGGNKHMQTEELKRANPECKITPVHMGGWADNYAGILGGHIDVASATIGDVVNQLSEGNFDILCTFAPERSELLPDVPTCEELGFGAVYGPSARGYLMPKGVDEATFSKIQEAFKNAITNPEHIEKMKELGLAVDYFDGEEYETFLKENEEKAKSMSDILGWQ